VGTAYDDTLSILSSWCFARTTVDKYIEFPSSDCVTQIIVKRTHYRFAALRILFHGESAGSYSNACDDVKGSVDERFCVIHIVVHSDAKTANT